MFRQENVRGTASVEKVPGADGFVPEEAGGKMRGKGLTMDGIVNAAMELLLEKGYNGFSVRELAQKLECRAASLYNHIDSFDDVNRAVGKLASRQMNEAMEAATEGKTGDEAVRALAWEYRRFAENHFELYQAVMGMPALDQNDSLKVGRDSLIVIRKVVHQYGISEADAVNFSRCFRGVLHGFVSFELAGYYTNKAVSVEDTFEFLINGCLDWIHKLEAEHAVQK